MKAIRCLLAGAPLLLVSHVGCRSHLDIHAQSPSIDPSLAAQIPADPANPPPTLPALHDAWLALFHFNGTPPLDPGGLKQLEAAREATRRERGEKYATYILDRANIATELANRVAMGTGVQPPRFRWVPYIDALLFPLDNSANSGPPAPPAPPPS